MECKIRPIGTLSFSRLYLSNRIDRKLKKGFEGFDETDRNIALAILKDPKYRVSAIGFLSAAKDISIKETVGIILFTGLVNLSDDYLDKDQTKIHDCNEKSLKSFLLSSKAVISGKSITSNNREINLSEIRERTLSKFTGEKLQAIESFLNAAIDNEISFQDRGLGEYTYEEAVRYRHNSSDGFTKVGLFLANISDKKAIEQYLFFAQAMDLFDDGWDFIEDCKNSAINPLIAYAFENGEGEILSGLFGKKISSKKALKHLPRTRQKYMSDINNLISKLDIISQRIFFHIVSKLFVE